MKSTFATEFAIAARQGPRLFFAPLVGAIRALRFEARRISAINSSAPITEEPAARPQALRERSPE